MNLNNRPVRAGARNAFPASRCILGNWALGAVLAAAIAISTATPAKGQALDDGELMFGWWTDVTNTSAWPAYAANGVNFIHLNSASWYSTSQVTAALNTAQSLGFKVSIAMTRTEHTPYPWTATEFNNFVNAIKGHPAVWGWYLADEPELSPDPALTRTRLLSSPGYYRLAKTADPARPSWLVICGTCVPPGGYTLSGWDDVTDIVAVDYYPKWYTGEFTSGELRISYDVWRDGLTYAKEHNKEPFVAVVQGFGSGHGIWTDMSVNEMKYHVMSAVVQGIKKVLWWYDAWSNAPVMDAAGRVQRILRDIREEMSTGQTDAGLTVSQPSTSLTYRYGVNGGRQSILAVNIASRRTGGTTLSNVKFTLPGNVNASSVTVLDENRTIPVINGSFTDTFAPFAVHVYQFNATAANDTQSPTVPAGLSAAAISSSEISLSWAASSDNVGVSGYRIYRGGVQVGTTAGTTYTDRGLAAATTYSYTVSAYDAAGNASGQSAPASATTRQAADTTAPSVSITSPAGGAAVTGTVTISAAASDNIGVSRVEFYIDGVLSGSDTSSPYTYAWNTAGISGTHTIAARAIDGAGNAGTSPAISVTVNTAATPPPADSVNLARGVVPVSNASISGPGGTGSAVTDASIATANWVSSGNWIRLDLGGAYPLNRVRVWHYYGDGRTYRDVIVQLSNDVNFASGVVTVFNNDTDNSLGQGAGSDAEYPETQSGKDIVFAATSARFVRLWSNGSSANTANHYVEVEVYGGASAPPAAAPVISNIVVSNITSTSAVVTWTTDAASDSVVEYGRTTAYGSSARVSNLTVNHSVVLSGLSPRTVYHFRVKSSNANGQAVSGDRTFSTLKLRRSR